MKVNDYVRSSWGTISRIKEYKHDEDGTGFSILIENECCGAYYKNKSQFNNDYKSSPNIIDLIEIGDYVNGMEVTGIGGTRWDKNDLHCYCEHNGNENWKQVMIPAKDIKSIVTHEQFSQMEYMVGE